MAKENQECVSPFVCKPSKPSLPRWAHQGLNHQPCGGEGGTTVCPGCLLSHYCRTRDCCTFLHYTLVVIIYIYICLFWCSKRLRSEAFCGRRGRNGRCFIVIPSLRIDFGYFILGRNLDPFCEASDFSLKLETMRHTGGPAGSRGGSR